MNLRLFYHIISSTLFLKTTSSSDTKCQDFAVSDCLVPDDSIVGGPYPIGPENCQGICAVTSTCIIFLHDGTNCFLVNQDYRKNCGTISAPAESSIDECLDAVLNSCEGFLEEDCVYTGTNLGFDPAPGEISDPRGCEEMCNLFGAVGCKYWQFQSKDKTCHLLGSGERRCSAIGGPKNPVITDCIDTFSLHQCSNSEESIVMEGQSYGTLDAHSSSRNMCIAYKPKADIEGAYSLSADLYNENSVHGSNFGHLGIIFNMQNELTYNMVYVRIHSTSACIQFVEVIENALNFTDGGECINRPNGKTWFNLKIEVDASLVTFYIDNVMAQETSTSLPSVAAGGVGVYNTYSNVVSFKNVNILKIKK